MTTPAWTLEDRAVWSPSGLRILDPQIVASVNRPYLSPSTADAVLSCPARMAADRATPRAKDVMGAAELGTAAHLVLDRLFQLPPGRRDTRHAMRILTAMSVEEPADERDDDYAKLLGTDPVRIGLWLSAVSQGYSGLWGIEDPAEVDVECTERRVSGIKIGRVPFKGIIDRTDNVPGGKLRVVDYKTGRPKLRPNPRFEDSQGEQVRAYSLALRALTGKTPASAHLYYTAPGGGARRVTTTTRDLQRTQIRLEEAWDTLRGVVDASTFPTKPSGLCGWCPLVNACPAAAVAGKVDMVGNALSAEALAIGVETSTPAPGKVREPAPEPVLDPVLPDLPEAAPEGPEPGAQDGENHGSAAHDESDAGTTEEDTMSETTPTRPWREAKPYDGPMIDGHLSLNSYAASAVFGMVSMAGKVLTDGGQVVGRANLEAMTSVLSDIVLDVQEQVTGGSRDWQEGSNTRIRGTVHSAVELIAPPFGAGPEDWTAWKARVTRYSMAVCATALRLYDHGPNPDALTSLATAPAAAGKTAA